MTPSMVEALKKIKSLETGKDEKWQPPASDATPDGSSRIENYEKATRVEENEKSGDSEEKNCSSERKTSLADQEKIGEGSKPAESSFENPKIGNPISHGQVIDLSAQLKALGIQPSSLDILLRGSWVYVPPPPPKPEPVRIHP